MAELSERMKKGGLTAGEQRELGELSEEFDSVKFKTEGPDANVTAYDYYRSNQNFVQKWSIPSPYPQPASDSPLKPWHWPKYGPGSKFALPPDNIPAYIPPEDIPHVTPKIRGSA
jgi:hypothetical protein